MIDKDGYEEIAEEAASDYLKGKNDNELKLIKDFITKINNGTINNKNKAGNEFRKLKQKSTIDILRQDLIKDLERYLFGEDSESIEPEKIYEESIAERVKTRRQNKETNRDTQRTFAPQDSSINLDDFTYGENYDELDGEDREMLRNMNKEEKGLKILSKQQMVSRLPVLLAQMQAGNNSKSLKNETRQLVYALYRSTVLKTRLRRNVYDIYKMEIFFMNTKNSKTNESHRFKYDLIDKLDLKNPNENMALANLSIYYTWKNVKLIYNNNKFKISALTWNETFDLPDGSYNIHAIQNYLDYIMKKHENIADTAPILIYGNNITNRIVFKMKNGYKLELLSEETMKLLGSTSSIIDANKNSENVPRLGNIEVVLVHCNLVNNSYQ